MRFIKWCLLVLLALTGVLVFAQPYVAEKVAAKYNPVTQPGPYQVAPELRAYHNSLFIADLHADPLLWGRDLAKRSSAGQVDLPRMLEGNMGLQVFGLVTKSPKNQNFDKNSADTDRITTLVMASGWPSKTWGSLVERALYQSEKLTDLIERSNGQLRWVRNKTELVALRAAQLQGQKTVGAMLGLEGAHALEGDIANLQRLYDSGVRLFGLAHFFDNDVGGSAHGMDKGGLTALGKQVIAKAQEMSMVIDLAHASNTVVDEILATTKQPVLSSHTGVYATCKGPRNLTDAQLQKIAATGGVVGIAMFKGAVCGETLDHTIQAMHHAVEVMGIDHVALGADMDGSVRTPIDVSGMPLLTQKMQEAGFSDSDIRKIMGENVLRVLRQVLPAK